MKVAVRRAAGAGLGAIALALCAPSLATASSLGHTQDITPPAIPAGTPVPAAVATAQQAINTRLQELSTLSTSVASSTTVVSGDRSALDLMISSEITGLSGLSQKLGQDSTLGTVRTDAANIVTTYHVYSFVEPVVTIVLSVDASLNGANLLSSQEAALRAAITAGQSAKRSGGQALSLFTMVQRKVASIENEVSGTNATLLALDPSSVPGSLPTLQSAQQAANRAASQLHSANDAVDDIVNLLASTSPSGAHRSFKLKRAA